jgi:hypothetical protein
MKYVGWMGRGKDGGFFFFFFFKRNPRDSWEGLDIHSKAVLYWNFKERTGRWVHLATTRIL